MHADLDAFKAYNDHYGFLRGDDVILQTARILGRAVDDHGSIETFLGHIGGDDFALITPPDTAIPIADAVVRLFDEQVPAMHDADDAARGVINVVDRAGSLHQFSLLGISLGIAFTSVRPISSAAEAASIAVEMKSFAKRTMGSTWRIDRRKV